MVSFSNQKEMGFDLEEGKDTATIEVQDEWLKGLLNSRERDVGRMGPMIPRVAASLLSNEDNKECYEPHAVSIGPYHRMKKGLERIEKLKRPMASIFIQENFPDSSVEDVYDKVKEIAREVRNWYAEDATRGMGDEEFAQMMFLDGCFVLQFMSCCIHKFDFGEVEMKRSDINWVQRDLVLLENQLPWTVLEALESYGLAYLKFVRFILSVWSIPVPKKFQQKANPPKESKLIHFVRHHVLGMTRKKREPERVPAPKHFLHFLHIFLFNRADFYTNQNPVTDSVGADKYTYRSVKELKKVGIDFQPIQSSSYTTVRFSRRLLGVTAKLELPGMYVNHLMKPILLNLAAYEMAAPPGEGSVMASSFICFMDRLIDDEEDVKELRSQGVLYNALGSDQTLANLFNAMGKDLVPDPKLYDARVYPQIDDYCYNHPLRIWIFKHIQDPYFKSPWSAPSLIAAILGLLLTIIQTYYSIHPSKSL